MKKLFNRIFVTLYIVISIFVFSNCSEKITVDRLIEQTIAINKPQCPMAIDKDTRLDSLKHPQEGTIEYFYTLVNNSDVNSANINNFALENYLINNIKNNAELKSLRRLNATFKMTYFDKNGVFLFSFDITPEKYNR